MAKWSMVRHLGALLSLVAATVGAQSAYAAGKLCGEPGGTPQEVQDRVSKDANTKEIFRDQSFVAFQNQKDFATWTFTLPGNPAHPTAVCRKPVREGDNMILQMDIVCKAPDTHCKKLEQDFKELNAQMQMEIESKQKQ